MASKEWYAAFSPFMWKSSSAPSPVRSEIARRQIQSTPLDQHTWAMPQVSMSTASASGKPARIRATTFSEAKESPRTPFLAVTVRAPQAQVEALESVKGDLEAASKAVGALTVAASDDAEATEAVVESFELGEAPAKRKG